MKKHSTISHFGFLEYGKEIPKTLSKKLNTRNAIAAKDVARGYGEYMFNGHGEDPLTTQKEAIKIELENIKATSEQDPKNYGKYMFDEHGISKGDKEGDLIDQKWQREAMVISSLGDTSSMQGKKEVLNTISSYFSQKGNICWVPIVSLEGYGIAEELSLMNDKDYSVIIHDFMPRWFRKIGLNPNNMEWAAAYHNNTDNPHIHFMFLEKEQTRTKGKLSRSETNAFRNIFTARAKTRARELGIIKTDTERSNMLHKQMDARSKEVKVETKLFLSKKIDEAINKDIYALYAKLDKNVKSGSLKYGSANMAEYRKEINAITDKILDHPDIKDNYEKLKESWRELDKFSLGDYLNDADSYYQSEKGKLYISIGNMILKGKKEFDQERRDNSDISKISKNPTSLAYVENRKYSIFLKGLNFGDKPALAVNYLSYQARELTISIKDEEFNKTVETLLDKVDDRSDLLIYNGIEKKGDIFEHSIELDGYVVVGEESGTQKENELREKVLNYSNKMMKNYFKCILNNIQDEKITLDKAIEEISKTFAIENNIYEAQDHMKDYIWKNKDQPDNPYYRDPYYRESIKKYLSAPVDTKGENMATKNRFVANVGKKLFPRNSFGLATKTEANKYWQQVIREDEIERQKEEMRIAY